MTNRYSELYKKLGDSAESQQWLSRKSQIVRFEAIARYLQPLSSIDSLIDVGCGTGDFYGFIRKFGFKGKYFGLDMTPEFISCLLKKNHGNKMVAGKVVDFASNSLRLALSQVVVCSGAMNGYDRGVIQKREKMIRRMFGLAKKQVVFNMASNASKKIINRGNIYYASPSNFLAYVQRNYTNRVLIDHTYLLNEFTLSAWL